MTLRRGVVLLVGAAFLITLALGLLLGLFYTQARSTVDRIVQTLAEAGLAVADLTIDTNNMDRRLRIHVSSSDEGYRLLYEAAVASAQRNVEELQALTEDEPAYEQYAAMVDRGLRTWLDEVGTPTASAMQSGEATVAQEILDSPQSQTAYVSLNADTYRLATLLAAAERDALAASAAAAQRLASAMVIALGVMLAIPLLSLWALWHNVLEPITTLREQMRRSARAGQHHLVIAPDGPPEIRDLGSDAEALRRALVSEIDRAEAARTALEQEGPVVEAIRRELSARSDAGPPGVHVSGILRPAEGVLAGDFWDRIPLTDGRMAAVVCDVSGHGPRAGIVAMRLKTAIGFGLIAGQQMPEILHRSCDAFADEPARFATVVIIVADPRTGDLEWVNAGHPAPRIIRADGTVQRLEATGPMVSWLVGTWRQGQDSLGPRDLCLAFTDGILESRDESGAELGDEALDEHLRRAAAASADPVEVTEQILAWVRERTSDMDRDDVTLVALRAEPTGFPDIPMQRG